MEFTDQAANLRKLAYSRNEAGVAVLEPEAQPNENIAETPEATEDIATSQETATRVIAVTSGKGGVGKSTLSVNLAISIARMGKKVLLFDGDLGLANVNVLMGIIPEHSIYEVIKGKKKIEDIIISTSYGIDIIAGANGISQLANLTEAQRDEFMSAFGAVGGYDVMLIDTGAGVGANVIGLVLAADEILVVTTPEPTAITDAYGMIKSIVANSKEQAIKLVVNRVPSAIEAKRVADRLTSISAQFLKTQVESLGFVFEEDLVQKSIRSQRPHVVLYPGSKSSACMNHISARLLNSSAADDGSGIFGFLQKLLG
ncbi:MAG: AAA family ATPase, partial [Leptospiraceae bacterium]|nr:AAA family ATPase [Leptospiraceae bacterium]